MHVPKTAGTSLVALLESVRDPRHTVRLYEGEYGIGLDELLSWSRRRRRHVALVAGHVKYGLADLLPGDSIYLTMLRDPVDRIVSHHSYVLTEPSLVELHDAHGANRSLEGHVTRSPLRHLVNDAQTRQLGGDVLDRSSSAATPHDLERARQRIDEGFAFVGLYEQLDTSTRLLRDLVGITEGELPRLNVTHDRPSVADLDPRVRATIEEHNQLDLALYAHARRRFADLIGGIAR